MDKKTLNLKHKKTESEVLELDYLKKRRSYKYIKLFFRAKTRKHADVLKRTP